MKKIRIIIIAMILAGASAFAQPASQEFKSNYERQVRNVGYDGVGVETIIDRWEAVYPADPEMLVARFNYYFTKSQSSQVVQKPQKLFLSRKPAVTLKDSTGADVNYFEETFYDDSLFARSIKAIDVAIKLYPEELRYRYDRITAMLAYEKEVPDIAAESVSDLIDMNVSSHPAWTLDGKPAADSTFVQGISEYCYSFFQIGSDSGYGHFLSISQKMNKLYPKMPLFCDYIGSYWQAYKKNYKQALKFYKKALKLDPEDYAATRNIQIIQTLQSKKGLPSK